MAIVREEKIPVSVGETDLAKEFKLRLINSTGNKIVISSINVNRPSFVLTGWWDHFAPNRIQLLGRSEMTYIATMSQATIAERFDRLCSYKPPCIIIARNLKVPDVMLETIRKNNIPLFISKQVTAVLMHDLFIYLSELLAPVDTLHGILLEISGIGVLLRGKSGIGKSETALELVHRGNRLVSDDVVDIKNVNGEIFGTAPEITADMMEVRGLGIVNVRSIYGIGSVLKRKRIQVIVELEEWNSEKEYIRTGDAHHVENILGEEIPLYIIPVTPGRNLAILIEATVSEFRLRVSGYSAIDELNKRMQY
ncbi:MAG: HPr(Ser) kinase/phosphatase [Christensenellaceae bacterium]|jgi:HPr kinase/phosphorylase|nr:HPr(Ser) kinase/phosphatase [Christensenellaceae bacterium]